MVAVHSTPFPEKAFETTVGYSEQPKVAFLGGRGLGSDHLVAIMGQQYSQHESNNLGQRRTRTTSRPVAITSFDATYSWSGLVEPPMRDASSGGETWRTGAARH